MWANLPWAQTGTPTPAATPRPAATRAPSYSQYSQSNTPISFSQSSRRIGDLNEAPSGSNRQRKSTASPTAAKAAAKPGAPAAGAAPNVVRRATRTPAQALRRGSSGARGKSGLVLAQIPDLNVLYLDPTESSVKAGEEFNTTIEFVNNQHRPIDSARVVLQYDPRVLMALGRVQDSSGKYLTSPEAMSAVVYAEDGLVDIQASFSGLPVVGRVGLATIRWKALNATESTTIDFVTSGKSATGVYSHGQPVLGDAALETPGVMGGDYQILPSQSAARGAEDRLTEDMTGSYGRLYGNNEEAVIGLSLRAPASPIKVGQRFFVDVILDNPQSARIDTLNLVAQFDPQVLQVEDYDEGNWIAAGINLFDGAYHKRYPFDVFIRNQAYNSLGEIQYAAGNSRSDINFPSGVMASILFSAVRPAPSSQISFHVAQDSTDNGTTATFMGRTILPPGSSGLGSASVQIVP